MEDEVKLTRMELFKKIIAGIFNKNKNVLGMIIPHPERMIDKYLSGEEWIIIL